MSNRSATLSQRSYPCGRGRIARPLRVHELLATVEIMARGHTVILNEDASIPSFNFTPTTQFAPLPTTFAELPTWTPTFSMPQQDPYSMAPAHPVSSPIYNENYAANQGYPMVDYLYPQWSNENRGMGLNQEQQVELMQTFEANETGKIQAMIQQTNQLFRPHVQSY